MKKHVVYAVALVIVLGIYAGLGATTVSIGTGTLTETHMPIFANYNYSYTQQIYWQSEIGLAGYITKLRFWYSSGSVANSKDWVVYMGHTTKTAFASAVASEWIPNLTQVYSGDISSLLPTSAGWLELTLQNSFYYNNIDNLVIAVDENTPSNSGYVYWGAYYKGSYSSMYAYNSSVNIDPNNLPGSSISRNYNSDRIELDFDDTVPVELSSITATISSQNFVNLTWISQSETAMAGYYVYRSTDSDLAHAELISPLIPATNTSSQQVYLYTDEELYSNGAYYYWLQTADLDGSIGYHGPVSAFYNAHGEYSTPEVPLSTELKALYPNPFNPTVYIPFSLKSPENVSIRIFNARGQLQKTFALGCKQQGNHQLVWDGTDDNGNPVSSGVYQIVMIAGKELFKRNAVLMK